MKPVQPTPELQQVVEAITEETTLAVQLRELDTAYMILTQYAAPMPTELTYCRKALGLSQAEMVSVGDGDLSMGDVMEYEFGSTTVSEEYLEALTSLIRYAKITLSRRVASL